MTHGRRPAGICGACLLLAARMNNFRRSVQEIVQVVKIADVTVRKRLEEFKSTPTGLLSVDDFRSVWLEDAADPPSFNIQRRKREQAASDSYKDDDQPNGEGGADQPEASTSTTKHSTAEEGEADFEGSVRQLAREAEVDLTVNPQTCREGSGSVKLSKGKDRETFIQPRTVEEIRMRQYEDDVIDPAIEHEIGAQLGTSIGMAVLVELDSAELSRIKQSQANALDGLDEEEIDSYILSEDDVRVRERIWVEHNKDYLEAVAGEPMRI